MSRYERLPLSAATDWKGILLSNIITPGDVIHVPTVLTGIIDEVYLWAENSDAVNMVTITVEFGGTGVGDLMVRAIPTNSGIQIVKGRPVSGGLTIAAFASAVGKVNIWGYVNRLHL